MSSPIFYNQDSFIRFKKRKARFSFSEVHILLDEVRKHRMVVVGNFNRGVPTDIKKRTWAEITARVNEIGECQREIIEVIKKWSDLKCDTKRKVGAMRSGTVPNRGLNSRLSRDLNQTEKIVLQILEMDKEDQSSGDFGPLGDDDDVPEEEEEMEEDIIGMQSSPNGGLDGASMPPPMSYTMKDSSQTAYDVQYEIPATEDVDAALGDSDDDQREDVLPSTKPTEIHQGNNGIQKQGPPPKSSGPAAAAAAGPAPTAAAAAAPATAAAAPTLPLPGQPSQNMRDNMLHNASLSLEEQHATNILLETVSRSLELLSESVQQLAETQQEFVRESLQLQRETVQVLRDFTDGAISLMHDKLNGRPAL
ncbi:nuclear apoptosis-inducing factor 1 [Gymnodraco acuticeps]|uniref:Nuclear apoptosis-inducing factor 1 n=1 Tax=Gymnodraco acuticeps TaxID=8218 RepID=A0A6P8UX41_GYMAC|nr:nuclear apoptosis-inducing factor 1 [Gymnodraco acuticeps]XP_034082466.1 nuclear apoptosis-inducing factor 1 [Gymnodraco acuticeps]XP_034082467.1 nuclear apoptosis-inducing factor 1 [Gymnodraco acuticeps]XP_034082469.1 nuclear apoptosis-inducing factor 1 [Gymnodraco acuticeps]XP_034082470.1 nuclear apoptosis-inducing factor 1 [Gymnodraco acuticeps]